MKILIHDERPDKPEFLLDILVRRGYKAGYATGGAEIITMLANGWYDVVLTNGGYRELGYDQRLMLSSSSVFIIGIRDFHNGDQDTDLKANRYLLRPFLISELWLSLEKPLQRTQPA